MLYSDAMKAYPVELRERIVAFVEKGGRKTDAARLFGVGRDTVYRFVGAARRGSLAPKPQGGSAKRFTSERLRQQVRACPSATLEAHGRVLGVSHSAVWKRLRQLAITLKKN
jgi:putative transposase